MPPSRGHSVQDPIEQERRIILAIQAINKKEMNNVTEAARRFNVPRSTLCDRINGHQCRSEKRANNHKLTEDEEKSLLEWIYSMDSRGGAPRQYMVRDMANLLLMERNETNIQYVGQHWVSNFVKRHPKLKSRFSIRYGSQRTEHDDLKVIQQWFDIVQTTIQQHDILDEDIYNFDEIGFSMGPTTTAKVVTRSQYYDRKTVLQPENSEWVTVIEAINASGWALPPGIIFKGKLPNKTWVEGLPENWLLEVSPNGWTTDDISVQWLKKMFIPLTTSRTKGKHRLLILDGHNNHLTPQFDKMCSQNNIISICMPPHSSHILQPLNIGCITLLKRSYRNMVDIQMPLGKDVEKHTFLASYPQARDGAFIPAIIKNSFAETGLLPLDANRVISKLNIQLHTPTTPQDLPSSRSSSSSPESNLQARRHAFSGNSFTRERSESPSTELDQIIDRLEKSMEAISQSLKSFEKDIENLRAASYRNRRRQRQEREHTGRELAFPEVLSLEEARKAFRLVELPGQFVESFELDDEEPSEPPKRRQYTCSSCNQTGHRANACPRR